MLKKDFPSPFFDVEIGTELSYSGEYVTGYESGLSKIEKILCDGLFIDAHLENGKIVLLGTFENGKVIPSERFKNYKMKPPLLNFNVDGATLGECFCLTKDRSEYIDWLIRTQWNNMNIAEFISHVAGEYKSPEELAYIAYQVGGLIGRQMVKNEVKEQLKTLA